MGLEETSMTFPDLAEPPSSATVLITVNNSNNNIETNKQTTTTRSKNNDKKIFFLFWDSKESHPGHISHFCWFSILNEFCELTDAFFVICTSYSLNIDWGAPSALRGKDKGIPIVQKKWHDGRCSLRREEGRGGEEEGDAGPPLNPASDDWPPSVPFEKPCMWPPTPQKKILWPLRRLAMTAPWSFSSALYHSCRMTLIIIMRC